MSFVANDPLCDYTEHRPLRQDDFEQLTFSETSQVSYK